MHGVVEVNLKTCVIDNIIRVSTDTPDTHDTSDTPDTHDTSDTPDTPVKADLCMHVFTHSRSKILCAQSFYADNECKNIMKILVIWTTVLDTSMIGICKHIHPVRGRDFQSAPLVQNHG